MIHTSAYLGILFIVVFFFIGLEYLYSLKKKKEEAFRAKNSIINVSMGLFERFVALYLSANIFLFYQFLQQNYGLFEFNKQSIVTWVFVFFLYDFGWYVYHRLGHRVNLFWAAHVVHHQSEDYNFTVSLAITPVQYIFKFAVWVFMPLLGVPIDILFLIFAFNSFYQFFLHTRYIPSNKWTEYIFVTPSLHRVHHGSNERYIDKNFGGMLIIWDRLFGSYQAEDEEVVYGLTKSIKKRTFENLLFHCFIEIGHHMKQVSGIGNKMLLLVMAPDWSPKGRTFEPSTDYEEKASYDYRLNNSDKKYAVINLIVSVVSVALIAVFFNDITWVNHVFLFLFFLLTFLIIGYRMEGEEKWKKARAVRLCMFLMLLTNVYFG